MPSSEHIPDIKPDTIEAPPFLGSWPLVYGAVIGYLCTLLALLYAITQSFRY